MPRRLKQMKRLGKEENLIIPASIKHSYVIDALDSTRGTPVLFPSDAIALKDSEPNRRYFMNDEARKWRATLKDSEPNRKKSCNQIIELLWKYKDVMGKVLPGNVKMLE